MHRAVLAIAWLAGCGRVGFEGYEPAEAGGDASTGGGIDGATGDAALGTFGTAEVGGSTQNTGTDRVWMSRFMLTEPAMVRQLVVYFAPTGGQGSSVRGVIYADANGTPTTLLGTTTDVMAPSIPATWVPLPFALPVTLAPGAYWLGAHNTNAIGIAYRSAIGASKFNNDVFSDGADPTYAGAVTTYSMQLSIYAEYAR